MARDLLDAQTVLHESGTDDPKEFARLGVSAARAGDYERGLIFLAEAYNRASANRGAKLPSVALSYYGVCLALHKGRTKEAAEFCQLAIEKEFYNAEHYLNLARVWLAGRSRRKAVEAADRGLALEPGNAALLRFRAEIGRRRKPVLRFLSRDNPLNVALGRFRHSFGGKPPKGDAPK
jgi:tetratricopeptide (TPR) repeat protein